MKDKFLVPGILGSIMIVFSIISFVYSSNFIYRNTNKNMKVQADILNANGSTLNGENLNNYFKNNPNAYFSDTRLKLKTKTASSSSSIKLYYPSSQNNYGEITTDDESLKIVSDKIELNSNKAVYLQNIDMTSVFHEIGTFKGITIDAYKTGNVVFIMVHGTLNEQLDISNSYATIYTLPSDYRPIIGKFQYKMLEGDYKIACNMTTEGLIRIGYSKNSNNNAVVLASGTKINYTLMYTV